EQLGEPFDDLVEVRVMLVGVPSAALVLGKLLVVVFLVRFLAGWQSAQRQGVELRVNELMNDGARRVAVEQTGLQVLAAEDEDDDLLILAVSDRVGVRNVLAEPVFHLGVAAV